MSDDAVLAAITKTEQHTEHLAVIGVALDAMVNDRDYRGQIETLVCAIRTMVHAEHGALLSACGD